MKTICLVLLAVSSWALPLSTNQAALAGPAHRQESSTKIANAANDGARAREDGTPAPKRPDHPKVLDNHRPLGSTVPNRPKQLSNHRDRFQSRSAINSHLAGNTPPARPTSLIRPPATSPSNVRHHSPNPPMITGSRNANARSTAAINGTRMSRKP